jgi:hypothetical protein
VDTGVHGSGEDDGGDWRGGSLPPPSHIFCLAAHQICVTNVTMAERGKGGPVCGTAAAPSSEIAYGKAVKVSFMMERERSDAQGQRVSYESRSIRDAEAGADGGAARGGSYGPRAMMVESDDELRRGLRWGGGAQAARKRRVEGEETSGGRPRKVSKESRHAGKTTRRGSY